MASLLAGRQLISKDGTAAAPDALEAKVVLLYFSASWCPPCHRFTPVLADAYAELIEAGEDVEVVYVPGDRSEDEMMKYFRELHGDWLALPMGDAAFARSLKERYGVSGIPSLVVVQNDGEVIDADARGAVQSRGPASFAAWKRAWRAPAFGTEGQALGGGGGVSRLVAAAVPQVGGHGHRAATSHADEDQALAAALAASMQSATVANARQASSYDEDAALAQALAASLQPSPALSRTSTETARLARSQSDEERERRGIAQMVAAAEQADLRSSEAELQVAAIETQQLQMDSAIARLTAENSEAVVRAAIALLVKIMSNIRDKPDVAKFRKIRKDNKQISGQVLVARGALALLTAVGFDSTADGFLLMDAAKVDAATLAHGVAALEAVLAGRSAAASAARAEHVAALRQDAALAKRKRDQLRSAVAGDAAARKDPNWKAKTFEKSGTQATFDSIGVDLNAGGG